MEKIDTLIEARWVVPVEPTGAVHEDHAVAVRDGRIVAIAPVAEAQRLYAPQTTVRMPGHALIPGLVNAHTHAAMTLLRGLADDLPLMEWLKNHIWPAEGRWVNQDYVADGTALAVAEMLRCGTTCFNDMYFFPDVTGRVCAEAGMRAVVGLIVIDMPTAWAQDIDEYLDKGLALHDQFRHHPLIATAFAPHSPYAVGAQALERVRVLADELDIPIHMHVHESAAEVGESVAQHGERPLSRLQSMGLVSPSLLAVHMTQLTDEEIALVAAAGAHVVHCPESNLKLASGLCRTHDLVEAGVNVALGTDGAASNNDLDMLGELKTAALLGKAVAGRADSLSAATALRMATLGGARALGLDTEIGSLEAGKAADVVAVDLSRVETQPLYNPISQIVYAAGRDAVTDVWIGGRHLLKDRVLTALDEALVRERAAGWQTRIAADNGAGG